MSRLLRIALAPLDQLHADTSVHFAWLGRDAQVQDQGQATLQQLAEQAGGAPVELTLHPGDSLLAELELPPLAAARLSAAVHCAAEPLTLDNSVEQNIIHGPRSAAGKVPMAWLPRTVIEGLFPLLARLPLKVRALYPAPFFLPVEEGSWTACLHDGYLVVRQERDAGWVHPLPDIALAQLSALPPGTQLYWVGESPAEQPAAIDSAHNLPATQRWAGPAPSWGWKAKRTANGQARQQWGIPLACCALAMLVWVSGLNLYAGQLESEGKQLQTQMSARVKQAFPEIPVILNPLQQARQQRQARLAGDPGSAAQPDFSQLLHQTAQAMPFIAGGVSELSYSSDALDLAMLEDAGKPPNDSDWQAQLEQFGLHASATDHGWRLQSRSSVEAASGQVVGGSDD